ncbi:Alpha/beta fold hydrolase [uncultured Gammaproteobacteria bacterium]
MALEVLSCLPEADRDTWHAPVLFVHGSYCGAWIWAERFMPQFAAQGFPCYAVSLRGHGGSDGDYHWASLDDYVADVEAVAKEIGTPCTLIGHSMGGLLVQHCLARGYRARGAVLLASTPPSGLASSAMHLSMFAPDIVWQLGLLQTLGPQAVSPAIFRRAMFSDATSLEAVLNLMPRLQAESHRIGMELLCPHLPKIPSHGTRLPVLVVGGDADVFLPASAFRDTARYYAADLVVLHGAPHGLMLDEAWWRPVVDKVVVWLKAKDL